MRKIAAYTLFFVSFSSFSEQVIVTKEEENAFKRSMEIMAERLEDPNWFQNMLEENKGCYIDKDTLVSEGTQTELAGVASTCVSYDLGMGEKRPYIIIPTRVKNECDRLKLAYNQCFK